MLSGCYVVAFVVEACQTYAYHIQDFLCRCHSLAWEFSHLLCLGEISVLLEREKYLLPLLNVCIGRCLIVCSFWFSSLWWQVSFLFLFFFFSNVQQDKLYIYIYKLFLIRYVWVCGKEGGFVIYPASKFDLGMTQ